MAGSRSSEAEAEDDLANIFAIGKKYDHKSFYADLV